MNGRPCPKAAGIAILLASPPAAATAALAAMDSTEKTARGGRRGGPSNHSFGFFLGFVGDFFLFLFFFRFELKEALNFARAPYASSSFLITRW